MNSNITITTNNQLTVDEVISMIEKSIRLSDRFILQSEVVLYNEVLALRAKVIELESKLSSSNKVFDESSVETEIDDYQEEIKRWPIFDPRRWIYRTIFLMVIIVVGVIVLLILNTIGVFK